MLDHDDSVNDIYDFDDYSNSSRCLPDNVYPHAVHEPQSVDALIFGGAEGSFASRINAEIVGSSSRTVEPTCGIAKATERDAQLDFEYLSKCLVGNGR
ncbi:hypothetical protein MTO96_010334 [Rhipicephalus appendiculatus]